MTEEMSEFAVHLNENDGCLFSSDYETFSTACAGAHGAMVRLIGHISSPLPNMLGQKIGSR